MATTSPQVKPEDRKIDPPWPIQFNRQNLLAACKGSGKGADLLYCLLNKTRWEIHNQKLDLSVKVIKFQFDKTDIHKALAKAGKTISQGSYSTNLRHFCTSGYVVNQAYNFTFEMHLDVIEAAFANPPEQSEESVKVSKRHTDTISREEYNSLVEVCVNLTKMCQSLTDKVSILTDMCQSLTQNPTIYTASDNDPSATTAPQSNALEIYKSNDYREKGNSAIAPSPCSPAFFKVELDVFSEDLLEAQSKQAIFAYSHEKLATDLQEKGIETVVQAASVGYTNETKPVSPPEKPKRGTRKPKVEQATLIDTNKKAVAYNEAEQRVFDWYCGCDFNHVKPEQNATRKRHSETLIPHVHSQEEMQSLADFTKAQLEKRGIKVYVVEMGNMTNSAYLNAWIASRKKVQRTPEVEKPAEPIILMDEKTKRNAERSKQVLIAKFQDRMDKKGKFQAFEVVHMVERLGMEVAPYLMEQYNALQQVAVSQ